MLKRLMLAAVAIAAVCAASPAAAEPLGSHWQITPFGGWTFFDGAIRNVTGNPLTNDLYMGGRLNYTFHRHWALEAAGGFTPTAEDVASNPKDVDFFHASGNLLFTPWSSRYGGPFLTAGWGWAQTKATGSESSRRGAVEYGAGLRLWMTDAIGLRLEGRNIYFRLDDPASPDSKIHLDNFVLGGGLTFALGATPRDTDGDGVPDKRDKCADTPKGAKVDATGCPTDEDADKVFDGLDACPGTPRGCVVDAKGCPKDADGDGVCDGIDACADTPKGAKVDAKGCPLDSDGDGVFDGLDQCEGTPKGAVIDDKGCPKDADGDGVFDGLDKCPDTPAGAKVDADGCPIELIERETELLDTGMIRLQNVNFETAKAEILPESYPTLDIVGQILTKWPELKIEVGGHTDSRGSNAANQKLSEARAKAVLGYLTQKAPTLMPEQFTVKGYGEGRPIAPNNNPENMAKNRRVEFVVLNKDVLKKESERRRLLMKGEAPADTTK